jgi:hypothetical protein
VFALSPFEREQAAKNAGNSVTRNTQIKNRAILTLGVGEFIYSPP